MSYTKAELEGLTQALAISTESYRSLEDTQAPIQILKSYMEDGVDPVTLLGGQMSFVRVLLAMVPIIVDNKMTADGVLETIGRHLMDQTPSD